ncbi:MAG: DedA family protein [Candidatus Moraniibacteriota bacterium]
MQQTSQFIFDFLGHYGYWAMLPLMLMAQVPVTLIAAMLSSLGIFWWPWVLVFSILGDLVGNLFLYGLGRWWGLGFVRRWGKYVGITEKRVSKMEVYFEQHGDKTLLIIKPIMGIYWVAFVTAGIVKMNFKKFLRYACLGSFLWASFLVTMGYFYGYLWASISRELNWLSGLVLVVGVAVFFVVIFYRKKHLRFWE